MRRDSYGRKDLEMVAKAKRKESGSLSSRDLIALGVFSLLFMVVSMLVVGITSMSVVAYCGCCAIAAIPAGIVWVYMHARVPRAVTSLVMALVFAVIVFVIGSGWPVALGLAVGGAVSELIRKAFGYGRFAGVAVGYALFETCWAAGLFVPMFASQDYYRELMGSNSIDPAYMEALLSTVTPETFAIIAVVTFAGGIIGSLVGRAVFKKHLERAGIA